MAKKACTKENILAAGKEREFETVVQNHPKWLRQESGKGSHRKEIYRLDNGEAGIPWAAHHGEVSIGVRRSFVRRMVGLGLLAVPLICVLIYLLANGG
jgi:hypothetical protein